MAHLQVLGLAESEMETDHSHEELVVLDRSGRLQIPREYLDALGIHGRDMIRAELEEDRIVLRPKEEK